MRKKTPLYQMPVCSTEFTKEAALHVAYDSVLTYSYAKDGTIARAGLRFRRTVAACQHFEPVCSAWHIDAYDTLVEVDDSTWATELTQRMPAHLLGDMKLRHFMTYLDSIGCIEVIAQSWEVIPEQIEE